MAKVIFTAAVASITGKLAGSVFQRSHGGPQLRTKVSPGNKQSQAQSAIRANMKHLTSSWGSLSAIQRRSWFTGLPPASSGFSLYVQRNQNLFIAGLPSIQTFLEGKPRLALTQTVSGTQHVPFQVPITPSLDELPSGYTQINRWSLWLPPGVRFASTLRNVLSIDNFNWDADTTGYAFDPAAADYPPAAGWSMRVAYGAIENASGVISLSNYLSFTEL